MSGEEERGVPPLGEASPFHPVELPEDALNSMMDRALASEAPLLDDLVPYFDESDAALAEVDDSLDGFVAEELVVGDEDETVSLDDGEAAFLPELEDESTDDLTGFAATSFGEESADGDLEFGGFDAAEPSWDDLV